jgi:hypothetical protein
MLPIVQFVRLAKHPEERTRECLTGLLNRIGKIVLVVGVLLIILYTAAGMAPDRKKACLPYCPGLLTPECTACLGVIGRADDINRLAEIKFTIYILIVRFS